MHEAVRMKLKMQRRPKDVGKTRSMEHLS
jgi:hypothetical protein